MWEILVKIGRYRVRKSWFIAIQSSRHVMFSKFDWRRDFKWLRNAQRQHGSLKSEDCSSIRVYHCWTNVGMHHLQHSGEKGSVKQTHHTNSYVWYKIKYVCIYFKIIHISISTMPHWHPKPPHHSTWGHMTASWAAFPCWFWLGICESRDIGFILLKGRREEKTTARLRMPWV